MRNMKVRTKHKARLIQRIMDKLADKATTEGLMPEDVKAALESVYTSAARHVLENRKKKE